MFRQVRDRFHRSSGIRFKPSIAHQLETAPDLRKRASGAVVVPDTCQLSAGTCVAGASSQELPKEVC